MLTMSSEVIFDAASEEALLRKHLAARLGHHPELESQCEVDHIVLKLNEWGVNSLHTLNLALSDSTLLPDFTKHLTKKTWDKPACPPILVTILRMDIREGQEDPPEAARAKAESSISVPSALRRFLSVLRGSVLEFMVPPDHMPWFKQHWIESRRDDSAMLKEEFMFLAELELLFGSLLFGAVVGGFYQLADDSLLQAFKDFDVGTFAFWTGAVGCVSVLLSLMQTATAYLTIFTFLPVHPNNFYAYVKSDSIQRWMMFGTVLIVISLYTLILFFIFASCHVLGGGWLVVGLTFGTAFVVIFPPFMVLSTNVLNMGMYSGAFGAKKIMTDSVASERSSTAVDDALVRRALTHIKEHGKPVPANMIYDNECCDVGARQRPSMGRRNQREKMATAALAVL